MREFAKTYHSYGDNIDIATQINNDKANNEDWEIFSVTPVYSYGFDGSEGLGSCNVLVIWQGGKNDFIDGQAGS